MFPFRHQISRRASLPHRVGRHLVDRRKSGLPGSVRQRSRPCQVWAQLVHFFWTKQCQLFKASGKASIVQTKPSKNLMMYQSKTTRKKHKQPNKEIIEPNKFDSVSNVLKFQLPVANWLSFSSSLCLLKMKGSHSEFRPFGHYGIERDQDQLFLLYSSLVTFSSLGYSHSRYFLDLCY